MNEPCQFCWDEAFKRSRMTGGYQAEIYRELVYTNWCTTSGMRYKGVES